jgi:hypothetical protein
LENQLDKFNCWEFKKCGRQLGGHNADKLGVCPASIEHRTDGMNSGVMGGRACWAITGTFCNGAIQKGFTSKMRDCVNCEFYCLVALEEGSKFQGAKAILDRLASVIQKS